MLAIGAFFLSFQALKTTVFLLNTSLKLPFFQEVVLETRDMVVRVDYV